MASERSRARIEYEEDDENAQSSCPPPMTAVVPPNGAQRVLLHSCCAPCSGAMIEEMRAKGLDIEVFFYNPNIHPRKEYELRKAENKRYADKLGIKFIDADYDSDAWFQRAKGKEFDPERGERCTMCFDMRMEVTALYAKDNGFPVFTTTNATSRWKDIDQVNRSGLKAAEKHEGVEYWVYDWQTDTMTDRKYRISAEERFYKQEYCGCAYSLRDSNLWRKEQGLGPIKIGDELSYFEDPEADAAEESQEVVDEFFRIAGESFTGKADRKLYADRLRSAADASGQGNNW